MRVWLRRFVGAALSVAILASAASASAQEVPSEYKAVLSALGKTGDFKDGVLKVNIPRTDLRVSIKQRSAPTPFGFGGWVAFTKGDGGHEVMMGDLVLTEDEVNRIRQYVAQNLTIEGDLRRDVQNDIKRKIEIGCLQGIRHRKGLPVRGQRTHTNARTRKGPKRTVANKKKAVRK